MENYSSTDKWFILGQRNSTCFCVLTPLLAIISKSGAKGFFQARVQSVLVKSLPNGG